MPQFISETEFQGLRDDPAALVARADEVVAGLQYEAEKLRAQAEGEAIVREQTCAQLEQRYLALAEEYGQLDAEQRRLQAGLAEVSAELAQARARTHQEQLNKVRVGHAALPTPGISWPALRFCLVGLRCRPDFALLRLPPELCSVCAGAQVSAEGEAERLRLELSEQQAGGRSLRSLLEQKNQELQEKDATIKAYLDKIVRHRGTPPSSFHIELVSLGIVRASHVHNAGAVLPLFRYLVIGLWSHVFCTVSRWRLLMPVLIWTAKFGQPRTSVSGFKLAMHA